jgi:hypothetical protein
MNPKISAFLRRFSFFLLGLALGMMLLNFFFSKKNIEFDYLPNARTLKSIRTKPQIVFAPEVKTYMTAHQVDSVQVMSLLYYGDVDFQKSTLKEIACPIYFIEPTSQSAPLQIWVERCDRVSTVQKVIKLSK